MPQAAFAGLWQGLVALRDLDLVYVGLGSFAIGSSQQQVRPCPLCPDSDQIPQRSEMTRCARSGSGLPSFGHLIDSGVLLTLDRTGVENFSADPLKPKTGFFIFPSPP